MPLSSNEILYFYKENPGKLYTSVKKVIEDNGLQTDDPEEFVDIESFQELFVSWEIWQPATLFKDVYTMITGQYDVTCKNLLESIRNNADVVYKKNLIEEVVQESLSSYKDREIFLLYGGGIDSTALMIAMKECGLEFSAFIVVPVISGIRLQVKDLSSICEKLGVRLIIKYIEPDMLWEKWHYIGQYIDDLQSPAIAQHFFVPSSSDAVFVKGDFGNIVFGILDTVEPECYVEKEVLQNLFFDPIDVMIRWNIGYDRITNWLPDNLKDMFWLLSGLFNEMLQHRYLFEIQNLTIVSPFLNGIEKFLPTANREQEFLKEYIKRYDSEIYKLMIPARFRMPLKEWFANELYGTVDLELKKNVDIFGRFMNTEVITELLEQHRCKSRDWSHQISALISFAFWINCIRKG